jgi:phosphopantothenoylcysteine decarboxylase/phosphopantothenate--cysteine ligase
MGHIGVARGDLLVVAPATADLMAKMAHGQANDLASTTLLATDKRTLCTRKCGMWHHAATSAISSN